MIDVEMDSNLALVACSDYAGDKIGTKLESSKDLVDPRGGNASRSGIKPVSAS